MFDDRRAIALFQLKERATSPQSSRLRIGLTANAFDRLEDHIFAQNHPVKGENYVTLKARDERISLTTNASDRLKNRTFTKNLQFLKTVDLSTGHVHTRKTPPLKLETAHQFNR